MPCCCWCCWWDRKQLAPVELWEPGCLCVSVPLVWVAAFDVRVKVGGVLEGAVV